MNIKLYKVTSPRNMVVKELPTDSTVIEITKANFIDAKDKKSPLLRIVTSEDLTQYNYCFIDFFGRYYYCEIEATANGCFTLACSTDLLMTYSNEIQATRANVIRNEYYQDTYYNDDRRKIRAYKNIVTKAFPNAMEGQDTYILMTIGNTSSP